MQKDSKRDKIPVAPQRAEFISDKPYGGAGREPRIEDYASRLAGQAMEFPAKGLGFAYEKLLPGVASFIGVADKPEGPIYASERLNKTKSGGKKLSAYLSAADRAKAEKAREEDKKEKSRQKKEEDAIVKAALTPEMSKEEARKELLGPLGPQAKKRVEESDVRKEAQVTEGPEQKILKDVTDAGTGDKNPEDVSKTYMEEFMDMMPEYEGKTGFEKGMDLMKFGMAIAAGESPNAIANISKGFLAMGDTFTEDAAERRKYKKEVAMAGAQHVLDRQKENRQFDQELKLRNIDAKADLAEARLENSAANVKTGLEILRTNITDSEIPRKEADEMISKYGDDITKRAKASNAHKLILRIAQLSRGGTGDEQAIGLRGVYNDVLYEAAALTEGMSLKGDGSLVFDNRKGSKALREAALDKLAANMASVILGESGKTISDRDRQLVKSMLGSVDGLRGAAQSEEVIQQRLQDLEVDVLAEMNAADAEITAFESNYANVFLKGTQQIVPTDKGYAVTEGTKYSDIFDKYRRSRLTGDEFRLSQEAETRRAGAGQKGQYKTASPQFKGAVYDYAALPEGASLADVLRAQAES